MRQIIIAAVLASILSTEGHATANASCSASDENIDFNFEALSGQKTAGPFFGAKATAELLAKEVPEDFRTLSLQNDQAQTWVSGTDFNLHFHRERPADQPFAEMDLLIETSRKANLDDLVFKGTYKLRLRAAPARAEGTKVEVEISGKATCNND